MTFSKRLFRDRLMPVVCMLLLATSASAQQTPGASPAVASKGWTGFYVGGGGAYSNVSVEVGHGDCNDDCYWWGDYYDYDQGDGDFGYTLHTGLRVHRFVALELGYLDTGTIGWDQDLVYMPEFDDFYNNRVDFSAKVTELSVLGVLPFADIWEVYLRMGAGFWDGESTQRLDQSFGTQVITRRVTDSGTDFLFGLGAGVTIADVFHIRMEFKTVGIDEDVLAAKHASSIDTLTLEGQFRFGRH